MRRRRQGRANANHYDPKAVRTIRLFYGSLPFLAAGINSEADVRSPEAPRQDLSGLQGAEAACDTAHAVRRADDLARRAVRSGFVLYLPGSQVLALCQPNVLSLFSSRESEGHSLNASVNPSIYRFGLRASPASNDERGLWCKLFEISCSDVHLEHACHRHAFPPPAEPFWRRS